MLENSHLLDSPDQLEKRSISIWSLPYIGLFWVLFGFSFGPHIGLCWVSNNSLLGLISTRRCDKVYFWNTAFWAAENVTIAFCVVSFTNISNLFLFCYLSFVSLVAQLQSIQFIDWNSLSWLLLQKYWSWNIMEDSPSWYGWANCESLRPMMDAQFSSNPRSGHPATLLKLPPNQTPVSSFPYS